MGAPLMKDGELLSPTYSDFIRSLPCAGCGRAPRSEQHHWPTRGASGVTNDLHSMPVCHSCHRRCEGASVVIDGKRLAPIPAAEQTAIVARVFMSFIERGRQHQVDQVMRDLGRWRESRVFTELVPE